MLSTEEGLNSRQQASISGVIGTKQHSLRGTSDLECNQNYSEDFYTDDDDDVDNDLEDHELVEEEILVLQEELRVLRNIAIQLMDNFNKIGLSVEDILTRMVTETTETDGKEDSHRIQTSGECVWTKKIQDSKRDLNDSQELTKLLNSTKDLIEHRSYYQINYPMKYLQEIEEYLLITSTFDVIEYLKKVQRLRSVLSRAEPLRTCGKVKLPLPRADKAAGYLYPMAITEPLDAAILKMQDLDCKDARDVTNILLPHLEAIKFAELALQSNENAISRTGVQLILNKIDEILSWCTSTRSLLEQTKKEMLNLAKKYGAGFD